MRTTLLTIVAAASCALSASAQDMSSLLNSAKEVAGTLGSAAMESLRDRYASGNNQFGGKMDLDLEATIHGKAEATTGSSISVSSFVARESTVTGDTEIKAHARTGSLEASMGSVINVASVRLRNATVNGMLKVDTDVKAEDISASTLSVVDLGSLSITGTRVGPVDFKSRVSVGRVQAKMGSMVMLGSAHF